MNLKKLHYLNIAYWFFLLGFITFFLYFEVPKKGFNLSDHGYYLAYANNFFRGIIDPYGIASVINGILIKLGLNYLGISRFYYFLLAVSGLLYYLSLRIDKNSFFVVPAAIIFMLLPTWTHMLSYQTAPPILLILGLGFLNFTVNLNFSKINKIFLSALSAFLLVFSTIANISLFPALFINFFLIHYTYPKEKNSYFTKFYVILGCLAIYVFFKFEWPAYSYFTLIAQTNFNIYFTLERLGLIALLIFGCLLVGYVACKIFSKLISFIPSIERHKTQMLTLITCVFLLFIGLRLVYSEGYLEWWNSLLIYALVFLGCLLVFLHPKKINKIDSQILFAILLELEYFIGMTITDPNPIIWRTQIHAGVMIYLVLLLLENMLSKIPKEFLLKLLTSLLFITALYFPLKKQFGYSYSSVPQKNIEQVTEIPKLNGIYAQPEFIDTIKQIKKLYEENNCKNKLFISWMAIPLFYYIFDRDNPSVIYFPAYPIILDALKNSNNSYCFLMGVYPGEQTPEKYTDLRYGQLINYLSKNSKKTVRFSRNIIFSPTDYIFYFSN